MKLSWAEVIKTIWPFIVTVIGAVVYIVIGLNNKAPANIVYEHNEKLKEHDLIIKQYKEKQDWLTKTVFDMANEMGINPTPPP